MTEALRRFVREAYEDGVSKEDIEKSLIQVGWGAKDAAHAVGEYVPVPFGSSGVKRAVPVPQLSNAKDAFFAIVTFVSAWGLAVYAAMLSFALIELFLRPHPFPWDPQWVHREIWTSIPGLVVLVPLWTSLTLWWHRGAKNDLARMLSPMRRWLTYVTVAVAAITVVIDLIWILRGLFLGDGHWSDLIDSIVVFSIASFFALFYYAVLRRTDTGR